MSRLSLVYVQGTVMLIGDPVEAKLAVFNTYIHWILRHADASVALKSDGYLGDGQHGVNVDEGYAPEVIGALVKGGDAGAEHERPSVPRPHVLAVLVIYKVAWILDVVGFTGDAGSGW